MPILLVEQNARAALQVADYGYVLETGELALEGPSAELASNPRVAATYLGQAAKCGQYDADNAAVGRNAACSGALAPIALKRPPRTPIL